MTERVKGFTVTLDKDIRVDDIEYVINAIKMIKHVSNVEPVISSPDDHIIENRVRAELRDKFYSFISDNLM